MSGEGEAVTMTRLFVDVAGGLIGAAIVWAFIGAVWLVVRVSWRWKR